MSLDTQLGRGYEGPYVYSGVRKDLGIMGPAFLHLSFGWVVLTAVDLPFSLVADTLLLPVSIRRDRERAKAIEARTQVETDRPALVHAKPGESPSDTARRLFDRCRDLLRLYQLDHSMEEIARMMQYSNADVAKKEAYRCRMRFRELLENNPAFAALRES